LGNAPISPRASAMKKALAGAARCTIAIPKRRTADAVLPGMENNRFNPSVETAISNVSILRHRP
jgi:hypothetical protein